MLVSIYRKDHDCIGIRVHIYTQTEPIPINNGYTYHALSLKHCPLSPTQRYKVSKIILYLIFVHYLTSSS
ncbi:unnamed protein product [Phytomonas sp. Hart1]|nr:unnamed protein product [Phytomonas sp. Hart1]|eukprot:CCW71969.1 unnamed protein product [Phytomonas sp. isolate Hart1]